ncbi:unnamed protein product [Calypogeia fissa]
MASLAPRRSYSSRLGGIPEHSNLGRFNHSSRPTPLQVDKAFNNDSPRSELIVAKRLQELSQLESPMLRELAYRLGAMLKIETPRNVQKFKHPYADLHVAERWEQLQGCEDWVGLLKPDFDPILKAEILRYGEFAQATYDAFDGDKGSKHYGTCKYTKSDLLKKVGLDNRGYEITNFIYATTDVFFHGPHKGSKAVSHQNVRQHKDESKHNAESGTVDSTKENGSKHGDSIMDVGLNENCKECNIKGSQQGDEISNKAIDGKCEGCREDSKQCNWIGFVAVCTSVEEITRLGRRDIVIAWRGSKTFFDWIADFMDYMCPAGFGPEHVSSALRVEKGFLHLYTSTNPNSRFCKDQSARDQVRHAIENLVAKYKHEGQLSITVTGHSLGSALATLCAYDIAECQLDLPPSERTVSTAWHAPDSKEEQHCMLKRSYALPVSKIGGPVNKIRRNRILVTVFSFGGPKVGNKAFVDRVEELGVAVLRVENKRDKVPKVPGLTIHRRWKKLKNVLPDMNSYRHVGVKLKVDNELSNFLQKPAGFVRAHCLEGYLHLVDSFQGTNEVDTKGCIFDPRVCLAKRQSSIRDHPHKQQESKGLRQRLLGLVFIQHRLASCFRGGKYKDYAKTYRDPALVNKYEDYLNPEHAIPPCWWQEKNKGLVRNANGEWVFPDRDLTIPGTKEAEKKELERSIEAAWDRSKPFYRHQQRIGGRDLSRHLTMR